LNGVAIQRNLFETSHDMLKRDCLDASWFKRHHVTEFFRFNQSNCHASITEFSPGASSPPVFMAIFILLGIFAPSKIFLKYFEILVLSFFLYKTSLSP